ncbi:hypothetical protein [Streptomyces sp. NPDC102462]|uniref:hypothetical protein n=1 Tax=Streptomyces sp. NPDC102462 TaxID=3366178 RepID=UPI003818C6DB
MVLPDGRTVPDVRLAAGRHLRPGAVYVVQHTDADDDAADAGAGPKGGPAADTTVRVTVREWDPRRALRLRLALADTELNGVLDATLTSPHRPRLLEVSGSVRTDAARPVLSRAAGRARVRFDDWWDAADTGRLPRRAPARARLDHPFVRVEARAVPRPGRPDGRWEIDVTVSVRGRLLLRPVAAVALRVVRRRLHRVLARTLDEWARQWNARLPELTAMDRARLTRALLGEP